MFELHLLDVGQGEAILMDLPDGSFALVDGGPRFNAAGVIEHVEQRFAQGNRFRFAAVSHWDNDHIAGLPEILSHFPPDELLQPGVDLTLLEQLCEQLGHGAVSSGITLLRQVCEESGIDEQGLYAPQEVRDVGEGVEMYALAPDGTMKRAVEDAISSTGPSVSNILKRLRNRASLVLWIRAYGRNLLLTGEVGRDEVLAMRQQFRPHRRSSPVPFDDPSAIWIKLPHHGSKHNACPELFQFFAAPRFVASASHGARWSHPHPKVLHLVHFSRNASEGHAMCTRLGKGCSLIRADRDRYRPDQPEEWVRGMAWNEVPNPQKRCYGNISVRITSRGECTVSGDAGGQMDCPYGGPSGVDLALAMRCEPWD